MKIIYSSAMNFDQAVSILGLNAQDLSKDSLMKNYRKLMMEHHPDKSNANAALAGRINEARDFLETYLDKQQAPRVDNSKFDLSQVSSRITDSSQIVAPVKNFVFYCFDGNNFKDTITAMANFENMEESSKMFQIACRNYPAGILVREPSSRNVYLVRKKGKFLPEAKMFYIKTGNDPIKDYALQDEIKKFILA